MVGGDQAALCWTIKKKKMSRKSEASLWPHSRPGCRYRTRCGARTSGIKLPVAERSELWQR